MAGAVLQLPPCGHRPDSDNTQQGSPVIAQAACRLPPRHLRSAPQVTLPAHKAPRPFPLCCSLQSEIFLLHPKYTIAPSSWPQSIRHEILKRLLKLCRPILGFHNASIFQNPPLQALPASIPSSRKNWRTMYSTLDLAKTMVSCHLATMHRHYSTTLVQGIKSLCQEAR